MTITIPIDPSCDCLEKVHTQVNNALLARLRKLKKRGAPWPKVRFLRLRKDAVLYEVGK